MGRRILSLFILINILCSFCIVPVYATGSDIKTEINVAVDNDGGVVFITGFTNEYGSTGIVVTDEDDNIYAVSETRINTDGSFNARISLPADLAEGQYKVVLGGDAESEKEQRSAVFDYTGKKNDFVWIEAENADVLEGYSAASNQNASDGKYIIFDSSEEKQNNAEYSFSVSGDGEYDIWLLSTPGNASYVSKYQWRLDNNDYTYNDNDVYRQEYKTNDSRQTYVGWSRISTEFITEGSHKLNFCCRDMREYNDFYYNVLDSILIVPKGWNWTPNDLQKPFLKTNVKAKINKVILPSQELTVGKSLSVIISASVEEKLSQDIPLFAAVYWKDELVCSNYVIPKNSSWSVGVQKMTSVSVTPPSYIPDGEYTVVCGFGFSKYQVENSVYEAGVVRKGAAVTPAPNTVAFTKLSADCSGNKISVSAVSDCDASAKLYMTMRNGSELWGVSETETAVVKGENKIVFSVPDGIKKGEYDIRLGMYGYNAESETTRLAINTEGSKNYKPLSNGVYRSKKSGYEHFWYVNQENTLIWDGEPYLPMGGMECPTLLAFYSEDSVEANEARWAEDLAFLDELVDRGVKDIYLNPVRSGADIPKFVWQFIMDELEKRDFRYGMQYGVQTSTHNTDLYYIRANSTTQPIVTQGVTASGCVTAEVDAAEYMAYGDMTAKTAKYTVINSNNEPVMCGNAQMEIVDGKLRFTAYVMIKEAGEYSVYFTPRVEKDVLIAVNCWDHGEEVLKDAKEFADKMEFGDGFREIIDPLSNESGLYNQLETIRPASDKFNAGYAVWLENKYKTISALNGAWGSEGILSFSEAAELIPTYTSPRAQAYSVWCINPRTNKIYKTDGRNGVMWLDFLEYRDESFAEFNNEMADALKSGLDVPVVIKNVWGYKKYFINNNQSGGVDGLGVEAYGDYDEIRDLSASTYGMVNSFAKTAWFIATETSTEGIVTDENGNESGMYGSKEYMHGHFDTLYDMGTKGVFDFLYSGRHSDSLNNMYGYATHPEQFEWLREYRNKLNDEALRQYIKQYVPRYNKVCVIPHNSNSYTSPNRMTCVLYYDSFNTLLCSTKRDNTMYMVSDNAYAKGDIVVANFENGPYSTTVGKEFGKRIENISSGEKIVYAGIRKDLGTVEQLDKYFTGEYGTDVNGNRVQILNPPAGAEILAKTADDKPWAIRYGNLWILARKNWCGYYDIPMLAEFGVYEASADMSISMTVTSDDGTDKLKSGVWKCRLEAQNAVKTQPLKVYTAFYGNDGILNRVTVNDAVFSPENNVLEFSFEAKDEDETMKVMCWNEYAKPQKSAVVKSRN